MKRVNGETSIDNLETISISENGFIDSREEAQKETESMERVAAQQYYASSIDDEYTKYAIAYSDYSKKGNAKLKSIYESFKNVSVNINNTEEAQDKIKEFKYNLKHVLNKKEEKKNKSSKLIITFAILAFILPILVYGIATISAMNYWKQHIETDYAKNDFEDAKKYYTFMQEHTYLDKSKEIAICEGLTKIQKAVDSGNKSYLRDGIDDLLIQGKTINVYYRYTQCNVGSSLEDVLTEGVITDAYTSLYKPDVKGYEFDSWEAIAVRYDGEVVSLYLDAKLSLITYKINYASFTADTCNNPMTYTVEDSFILNAPIVEPPYHFHHWTLGSKKITEINQGTTGDLEIGVVLKQLF